MSTSSKSPNTIRHGGPGASHENAKEPAQTWKPAPDSEQRKHSQVSGGGGEKDKHHGHDPDKNATSRDSHEKDRA